MEACGSYSDVLCRSCWGRAGLEAVFADVWPVWIVLVLAVFYCGRLEAIRAMLHRSCWWCSITFSTAFGLAKNE